MSEELIDSRKLQKMTKDAVGKVEDFISEKTVSEESRLLGALCYIIIVLLPLVILLTKRKDKFTAFHAYQSLVFFGAVVIYSVLLGILVFIIDKTVPLLSLLFMPMYLLPLIVFLYCAWNAYKGRKFKLPAIGDMAIKAAS